MNVSELHWELTVLTRAVAYPNLTAAAAQVGLSQPQLSRIVAKLEKETGAPLLDRAVRRKSTWAPLAYRVAETYARAAGRLSADLAQVLTSALPTEVRIGTLEGCIPIAVGIAQKFLKDKTVKKIELDAHDLNRLEELFLKGDLDLIVTSREPGRKSYALSRILGYQAMREEGETAQGEILSAFEAATLKDPPKRAFISNSLMIRRAWHLGAGGRGRFPSEVRAKREGDASRAVLLIAQDSLSPSLWKLATAR